MNKTCARCEKTVYPTEELKCLDKVWHKGCFKCQECGMTLNMRTYKGYGKLPYCESHVPKAKHTTMAETPELKRIAENTKLQSNVKYHADFEKSKGKCTQVADDPETRRITANSRIISNASYHGDLEKKAQMEKQRQINENGEVVDVTTDYNQQIDNYATEMLPPPHLPPKSHYQSPQSYFQPPNHQNHQTTHQANHQTNLMTHPTNQMTHQTNQMTHQTNQMTHPTNQMTHQTNQMTHQSSQMTHQSNQMTHQTNQMTPHNANQPQSSTNRYQDPYYKKEEFYQYQEQEYQKIGKIHDYDPMEDGPRAPLNTQRASSTVVYSSNANDKRGTHHSNANQSQQRQIGRVTDYDPLANEVPRASTNNHQPLPPAPAPVANQKVYIAMYDYEANDNDEVSFREGDLISNVSSIDEGWMTGQVLRTGRAGMLPANYVAECPPHAQHY